MENNGSGSRDINPIRLLAGLLLLYFAWQLLFGLINGEASNIFLSVCGVILFAVCGGGLLVWELRMHRLYVGKGKKKTAESATPVIREAESTVKPEDTAETDEVKAE